MSAIGSGYDDDCGTYSPDGRVYQVEYAQKATENYGQAVSIKAKNSIVMAVQVLQENPLVISEDVTRIFAIDDGMLMLICGMLTDGRALVSRAREYVENYRQMYAVAPSTGTVAENISNTMQQFTHYSSVRPFGCSVILAGQSPIIKDKPSTLELYHIEPSGDIHICYATAAGKRAHQGKAELERIMSIEEEIDENVDNNNENEIERDVDDAFAHLKRGRTNGGFFTKLSEQDALEVVGQVIWSNYDSFNDPKFALEFGVVSMTEDNKVSSRLLTKKEADKILEVSKPVDDDEDEDDFGQL